MRSSQTKVTPEPKSPDRPTRSFCSLTSLYASSRDYRLADFFSCSDCSRRLLFSDGLQIGKTGLELLADHAVHTEKYMDDLRNVGIGTMHGPRDIRGIAFAFQRELSDVVGFKRLDEIQFDN